MDPTREPREKVDGRKGKPRRKDYAQEYVVVFSVCIVVLTLCFQCKGGGHSGNRGGLQRQEDEGLQRQKVSSPVLIYTP